MSYRDNLAAAQARADAAMKSLAVEREAREDDTAHVASLERTLADSLQELAELRKQGVSDSEDSEDSGSEDPNLPNPHLLLPHVYHPDKNQQWTSPHLCSFIPSYPRNYSLFHGEFSNFGEKDGYENSSYPFRYGGQHRLPSIVS